MSYASHYQRVKLSSATVEDMHETARILSEEGQVDFLGYYSSPNCHDILHTWEGSASTLRWLLYQSNFSIRNANLFINVWEDMLYHQYASADAESGRRLFMGALWSEDDSQRIARLKDGSKRTVLMAVLESITYTYTETELEEFTCHESAHEIVVTLIAAGADVHAQNAHGDTPLDILLTEVGWAPHRSGQNAREKLIEWWLGVLRPNICLHRYVQREQELHPEGIYFFAQKRLCKREVAVIRMCFSISQTGLQTFCEEIKYDCKDGANDDLLRWCEDLGSGRLHDYLRDCIEEVNGCTSNQCDPDPSCGNSQSIPNVPGQWV